MLKEEYKFWLGGVGGQFVEHWKTHPQSSLAKYYAIVTSHDDALNGTEQNRTNNDGLPTLRLCKKHRVWVIMSNAFAGIIDVKTDKAARIYDLKGSDRRCGKAGKENPEC